MKEKQFDRDYETESIQELHKGMGGAEITYRTTRGTEKTITAEQPSRVFVPEEKSPPFSEDSFKLYTLENGKYVYDNETGKLYSSGDGWEYTLVSDEVLGLREIEWPDPAPVKGAVEEDVDATVYYITKFGNESSFEMKVDYIDGNRNDMRISGERKDGKRVEVWTSYARRIVGKQYIGTTTRVEFPRGQQFSVSFEGRLDLTEEGLQEKLADMVLAESVEVEELERMEWD